MYNLSFFLALTILCGFHGVLVFSLTRSYMSNGEVLGANETLLSPQGKFEMGFASKPDSNSSFVLAIWYKIPSEKTKTIVWEVPMKQGMSNQASLSLSQSGDLNLKNSNKDSDSPLWTSATAGKGINMAALLDTGNLVLMAANGKNETIWQSFDHPSDTLLPGQTLNSTFAASPSPSLSPSAGKFVFTITTNAMTLAYNDTPPYWIGRPDVNGSNITSVFFREDGTFGPHSATNESSKDYHYPIDYGEVLPRRLKLDPDGNMRMYSWNSLSSTWVIVWKAVLLECNIIGRCGPYSICVYNPHPNCICPPGFKPSEPNNPSMGCTPNIPINCTTSTVIPLERVTYQLGDLYPTAVSNPEPVSASNCIKKCLKDCVCLGAAYKLDTGRCSLKQTVGNGYESFSEVGDLFFLKVSSLNHSLPNQTVPKDIFESNFFIANYSVNVASPSVLTKYKRMNATYKTATGIVSSLGALELLLFLLGLYFIAKQRYGYMSIKAQLASLEEMIGAPSSYSYKELVAATSNFSECLGTGTFASVYKGVIKNVAGCIDAAVKKLEYTAKGSEKQFHSEVMTIAKVHHVNLVRLYGFCSQPSHRMLVYEYMPNGSLDRFLFSKKDGKPVLDWDTRFTIAVGTARGIAYLHEGCRECILHCDIKPQNILLDANLQPKVSDFGLAKLINKDRLGAQQRKSKSVSKAKAAMTIRGTPGYIAPEWLSNQLGPGINEKVDVYSFGIVLLELVTGRHNSVLSGSAMASDDWHLPTWVRSKVDAGHVVDVIDPNLQLVKGEDLVQVERLVQVALLCIDYNPMMRPSMSKVVQMLEGYTP